MKIVAGALGLRQNELDLICSVFPKYTEIIEVIVFGSRAKGNYRFNSDIDLAVKSLNNDLQVSALAQDLNELPLPYKFDIQSLSSIKNFLLLDHIKRVGKVIYDSEN